MNRIAITLLSAVLFAPVGALADGHMSAAPANAEVYFVTPSDGDTVQSPVKVVFGLRNMGVAPAGTDKEGTGHHHLLIDTDMPSDLSKPLPATDQVKHFGGGQTETEIMLPPGEHTLQLLLGNYAHVPHSDPVMSEKITITVE
ncbi:DUF4399 domain-containing protein [Marinobacter sediminum]|uniref:DUF4399 domain-containing protein n=1 Tax=Marinobacter sediminum TaxID=256323 RepID=UPI00193A5438|nr:DUF4399 domain-containing protein [Marinobacter sediminum]